MIFKFFETKRRHIALTEQNELFATDRQYENVAFKKLDEILSIPLDVFEIESESMVSAYRTFTDIIEKERLRKKEHNQSLERWAIEVQNNCWQFSAIEIYNAALILNKRYKSWQGADMLLADSPFSEAILKKAKKYTVTPFVDGFLLIKIDGKRFGNKRGWSDISDFLNEEPAD